MDTQTVTAVASEYTPRAMEIHFLFLIEDRRVLEKCESLLKAKDATRRFKHICRSIHSSEDFVEDLTRWKIPGGPDRTAELLTDRLKPWNRSLVVVSDQMAAPVSAGEGPRPTPWWQALVDRFVDDRLGSVAITGWAPRRVPDVDRVVSPELEADSLFEALARTVRTLEFKQSPGRRQYLGDAVRIRNIRTEAELRDYYRLRHRVYSIMGYLDHRVEDLEAEMEFDWCDRNSVPIGAFTESPDGPRLIGTTRLIIPREYSARLTEATLKLAREDATGTLRRRFDEPYTFQMPFLQSHPDNKMTEVLQLDCPDGFAELSRVIVDGRYRGLGLSKRLVGFTMTVARWMGMCRVFLECLPTHRRLYEHFRFRVIPGRRERVYNVNKTMDLMEWAGPQAPSAPRQRRPAREELELLSEQGYLCLCHRGDCPGGEPRYKLHRTPHCPLADGAEQHLLHEWNGMRDYYEE